MNEICEIMDELERIEDELIGVKTNKRESIQHCVDEIRDNVNQLLETLNDE